MLLLLARAFAWTSASTTVTAGPWTIAGHDGTALHTHGGAPARLGEARFAVTLRGDQPAALTVTGVEFLTGHDCEAPPATVKDRPSFGGLFTDGMTQSAKELRVEPGKAVTVDVGFSAVEAYYTWCDRFAFRVTFRAGNQTLTAVAETNVTREEPLR